MTKRKRKPRQKMSVRNSRTPGEIQEMIRGDAALQDSYNSLSRYLTMHRSYRDRNLEPLAGSILHQIWQKGQLRKEQLLAWHRWYGDVNLALGNTNGLVCGYQASADKPSGSNEMLKEYPGHGTYWSASAASIEEVWGQLRSHEKGLLEQLMRDMLRVQGHKELHAHDLRYLGNILSGYNDNRQKVAAGVSAIQRLLSTLAEIYRIPNFF